MVLPLDGHVHSEWSWDSVVGDMEATCARAVELGLPAVAFTEHVDHTRWLVAEGDYDPRVRGEHGRRTFTPGPLDVDGYLSALAAAATSSLTCVWSAASTGAGPRLTSCGAISSSSPP